MATDPEKKIIVDEDWKSQVAAEREAQRHQEEPPPVQPAPPSAEALPAPSLTYLAGTLYLQGVIALGLLPNPISGKPEVDLARARHAIDTLEVLQQKTEGNRTPDESEEIELMLHQLRLGFVETQPGVANG
jgi:hypothetical protein